MTDAPIIFRSCSLIRLLGATFSLKILCDYGPTMGADKSMN